jgi:two-component system cell cycle response regulator
MKATKRTKKITTADEEALARQLYDGATRDPLTGLFNRKYARERLTAEIAYAQRQGTRLGLIMADIDHFKRVNDGFGHAAGDIVLRLVAAQMQRTSRFEDLLARYGGEEFVVRGVDHPSVRVLAERVRRAVQRLVVPWESASLSVTLSLGVASLVECGSNASADALVAIADERLYRAKARGRNRVC